MRTIYAAAEGPRRPEAIDGAPMHMADIAGVTVGKEHDEGDKEALIRERYGLTFRLVGRRALIPHRQ